MNILRGITLMAATLSTGFVAAIFVHWSVTVVPGLRSTDDRTFVGAFQQLDKAINNPLFLGFGFVGAVLFTAGAGAAQLAGDDRAPLPWVTAALVLYLVAVVVTFVVHLPLNERLQSVGDPARIGDLAAVRDEFRTDTWLAWNHVRAVTSAAAFGCLAWALVLFGRALP